MRLMPPAPVCNDAEFSSDGLERLWLSRVLEGDGVATSGPVGLVIGLNPSTAGADVSTNDHTIVKLTEFTRRWGWSGFWMGNLFTCIETYSANLKNLRFETAVGRYGTLVLENMIREAPEIVVCWGSGVPKDKRHRIGTVCTYLRVLRRTDAPLRCFGLSKDGHPLHPLRLAYETKLVPFELPSERPNRRDD